MWTFTIPGYLPPTLNVLLRRHWSYRKKSQREADDLVGHYGKAVPQADSKRRVTLTFCSPRTPADPDGRLKIILDALVHAGLLVDDAMKWCEVAPVQAGKGKRGVIIILEDIT